MLRIKICGLTTPQDAVAAIELGADALGFNFFPGSKRYVGRNWDWVGGLPGNVDKVAILVNPSWDEATAIATAPGITALQLHGAETPEFCRRLIEEGIRFEKALAVTVRIHWLTSRIFSPARCFSIPVKGADSGAAAELSHGKWRGVLSRAIR